MQKKLLFVLSHAPHSHSLARDCLDAVMTAALLNQSVSLLFIGEGIEQFRDPGAAKRIEQLLALSTLDLYVREDDVATHYGQSAKLAFSTMSVTDKQIGGLFEQHDRVLSF